MPLRRRRLWRARLDLPSRKTTPTACLLKQPPEKHTHTACSRRLAREVKTVFPGIEDPSRGLLVVPTFQRASAELLTTSEVIDVERDRLLERVRFCFLRGFLGGGYLLCGVVGV